VRKIAITEHEHVSFIFMLDLREKTDRPPRSNAGGINSTPAPPIIVPTEKHRWVGRGRRPQSLLAYRKVPSAETVPSSMRRERRRHQDDDVRDVPIAASNASSSARENLTAWRATSRP
jgi:hypothetical protein